MINSTKVGNFIMNKRKEKVMKHVQQFYDCYEIGRIECGNNKIEFENRINWV